jgi:hypothetical protein
MVLFIDINHPLLLFSLSFGWTSKILFHHTPVALLSHPQHSLMNFYFRTVSFIVFPVPSLNLRFLDLIPFTGGIYVWDGMNNKTTVVDTLSDAVKWGTSSENNPNCYSFYMKPKCSECFEYFQFAVVNRKDNHWQIEFETMDINPLMSELFEAIDQLDFKDEVHTKLESWYRGIGTHLTRRWKLLEPHWKHLIDEPYIKETDNECYLVVKRRYKLLPEQVWSLCNVQ